MVYNLIVANPERLTTLTITIKGPLSPLEAQDVMFGQVESGRNITCITSDKNGDLKMKTRNPRTLIEDDDIGQLGDLHATIQQARQIIINSKL